LQCWTANRKSTGENEELATVNAELQSKVADLTRSNNDMSNLPAGTGIATVFVDLDLRILRFTPAATRIINLIQSDIGRPVGHIVSNLANYDHLLADTQKVLDTLISMETEVQSKAGTWYIMLIQPYRTLDNLIEGAVITFVDINSLKEAQEKLRQSENRFRTLVASSAAVYVMSPDWSEMRQLHGRDFIPDTHTPSRTWLQKYIHPDDRPQVMEAIKQAIRTKGIFELEHRVLRVDGSLGWRFSRAIPVLNAKGEIVEWFGTASDITECKQAECDMCHMTACRPKSRQASAGKGVLRGSTMRMRRKKRGVTLRPRHHDRT
jgi:two-component system, chemotaxis family, CheB/CheR fusion protein